MSALPAWVPPTVADGVRLRWPDRAEQWIQSVERELSDLCARFESKPKSVFPARYGFLVAADTPSGGIVLRSSPDPSGPLQAQVAVALAALDIAPAVHDVITTETGTWTILDEVRPGTPLPSANPSAVTLHSLVGVLTPMRGQPPPGPGMPSIFDWLRERLEDDDLVDRAPGTTVAPVAERREALELLD